jgi:hypothetical protein
VQVNGIFFNSWIHLAWVCGGKTRAGNMRGMGGHASAGSGGKRREAW